MHLFVLVIVVNQPTSIRAMSFKFNDDANRNLYNKLFIVHFVFETAFYFFKLYY